MIVKEVDPENLPPVGDEDRPTEWTDDPELAETAQDLLKRPPNNKCNGRHRHVYYCERPAGDGVDGKTWGRCAFHGGNLYEDGGPPKGNTNNYKHGLQAMRSTYYDKQDPEDKEMIDSWQESMLSRADFGDEETDLVQRVKFIAIDMHKQMRAQLRIDEKGLVEENVVGVNDLGEPIYKDVENHAHRIYDRLSRGTRQEMKELGISPQEEKRDEARKTFAQVMEEIANSE